MSGTAKRDLLVVTCAVSAGVHAALAPEHFDESVVTGLGFVASAAVLAALVVALNRGVAERLVLGASAANFAALLLLYAFAATTGVPVLHPDVDPVDAVGIGTKAIELLGLAFSLDLLRPHLAVPSLRQPQGARS